MSASLLTDNDFCLHKWKKTKKKTSWHSSYWKTAVTRSVIVQILLTTFSKKEKKSQKDVLTWKKNKENEKRMKKLTLQKEEK